MERGGCWLSISTLLDAKNAKISENGMEELRR